MAAIEVIQIEWSCQPQTKVRVLEPCNSSGGCSVAKHVEPSKPKQPSWMRGRLNALPVAKVLFPHTALSLLHRSENANEIDAMQTTWGSRMSASQSIERPDPIVKRHAQVQDVAPAVGPLPEQTRFCPLFGTSIAGLRYAVPSLCIQSLQTRSARQGQ